MISFKKWLEQTTTAATTTASIAGSSGATTSQDIAPFLRPIGTIIRRYYPNKRYKKRKLHKKY